MYSWYRIAMSSKPFQKSLENFDNLHHVQLEFGSLAPMQAVILQTCCDLCEVLKILVMTITETASHDSRNTLTHSI